VTTPDPTGSTVAPDAVLAAAERWVWVPAGTPDVTTDSYRLTHYPAYSSVQWSHTTRDLDDVIDEAVAAARDAGSRRLRWWITDRTVPVDTAEALQARGFDHVETVEVLALPLHDPRRAVPVPEGVEVVEVVDRDTLVLAARLGAEVFAWPEPTDAEIDEELAQIRGEAGAAHRSHRYLALVDGQPAATAGYTLDGDALRLWGGSTRPELRGRGAYRALVARRLADGLATGADFAVVKAVDDTSSPILRRLGFEVYGAERCYQLTLI
jgi:hypothetical protein